MISDSSEIIGVLGSKSRSIGQISVKACLLAHLWPKFLPNLPVHETNVYQVSDLGPSWASCFDIETDVLMDELL